MSGLSDAQQAGVVLVSASLIAVGYSSVPAGAPWWVSLSLGIVGAIGLALKEALGGQPPKAA